jgi:hypothetical protein
VFRRGSALLLLISLLVLGSIGVAGSRIVEFIVNVLRLRPAAVSS